MDSKLFVPLPALAVDFVPIDFYIQVAEIEVSIVVLV